MYKPITNMAKLFNLFLISLFISFNISAQETVYFSKDPGKKSTSKKKGSSENNIVKISPLAFIGGIIPAYFERSINETFSVQVGAGITSKNYIGDAIRGANDNANSNVSTTKWSDGTTDTYTNENDVNKNKKTSIGYFVALEPRVYFASEGLDGGFMGISLSRAKFNSTSQKIVTGSTLNSEPKFTAGTFNASENITDLLVNFGTQTLYDHISLEYTAGIGLRKIKGTEYAYGQNFSAGVNNYVDGVSTLDKTKLGYHLSLKVGYHF